MLFNPTLSQMSFYTGSKEIDSYLWNQGIMQIFPERFSYEQLNNAYNKLVRANESLRVNIEYTDKSFVLHLKEYQYKNYPHWILESEEELDKKSREFLNEPIDFSDDHVRCAIFETPSVSGIMISGHHMFVDGYSVTVMTEHINEYLRNPDFVPPAYQKYSEYMENEEKHKNTKRFALDYKFWQKEFDPLPTCSIFSETNNTFDYESSEANFFVATEMVEKIKVFSERSNISVQLFFNAVYAAYFHRMTGNERFTLGVPVLNRTTAAEFNTIGLYMHIVPMVIECDNESFLENALKIEDSQMNLFRHQKITQTEIKGILEEKNIAVNRLFDVAVDYQEFGNNSSYEIKLPYSNYLSLPLEIHMQSFGNEKHNLKIRYRTSMFTEKEIQTMLNSFIAIIEDALENPDKKISELEMVTADEKQKVLYDFNDTAHTYDIPENSTLYSLFEKTAKENENKICIRTAETDISFGELKNISENLDAEIRNITKDGKSVVAIIAERSVEMYAAIYGIIRGGNAYLPIDPDYPQERIDYILRDSGAAAVAVQGKFADKVKNIPCIDLTELIKDEYGRENILPCAAEENDTAYVIYTSGSTGNPKGAKVSHKSAVNRILWMHDKYPLGADDVILQKTPYTFDVSVWEHFWWGMCGGSLAVSKPGEHFLPAKILDEVSKNKVTHIHFVPSVFDLFLNYLETHTEERDKFDSVKYVFLSGEALTANLVERFYRLYDYEKVTLHNLYGPTECAVDVTYYDCTPEDIDPIPIGKPIYNTQMYVVDKHNKPVPIGVTGELCIAGMNVGQGYLNNPELTAEKFIDNPFGEGKLYRTGDLAFWREDGNIVFCGRKDFQIKLNGQRIEISEIEAVVSGVPGVENVAVMVRDFNHRDVLVAFYCGKQDKETEIKDFCREKLPKYMVPSFVVYLDVLPLNNNGKLDRKILSEAEVNLSEAETYAPIDDSERYICEAFEKILGKKNIGRNSDFFELGGTSLSMISLLSENGFENITSAEFLKNPTPAGVAFTMHNKKKNEYRYIEPLYISEDSERVLILFPFAGGGTESYSQLISALKRKSENISVYFIRYLHSFEECADAADEIAANFKGNKIFVYSHCVGAAVALQIIKALESKKVVVEHYFAGAAIPPEKPSGKNIWKAVPDRMLSAVLSKAGARLNVLSAEERKEMLVQFRKDTDFANISFAEFSGRIKTPVSVFLTRNDLFTYNCRQADKIWKKYAEIVEEVSYIDSKTHYFQRDNSEELINLLLSYMN